MKYVDKNRIKFVYIFFFLIVCFLLLMVYRSQGYFDSDEGDVFLGGKNVAHGYLLYQEVCTHHMPIMYYISAFFSLLGASTVLSYRICFYLLMAALWGLMLWIYSDRIPIRVLTIYPIIYILLLATTDYANCILSEQFQGIGMAILLFELLIFEEKREIKLKNITMISLAVFISFGSGFVSIFAIFFVCLTFILIEMVRYKKEGNNFLQSLKNFVSSYWKLLFAATPFLILIVYYVFTGTLDDFYSWAYRMNREVYSKYNGGYGENILAGMFGGILNYLPILILTEISEKTLTFFVVLLGALYSLILIQQKRKNVVLTVGIVLFLTANATRGVFSFHGLTAISVLSVLNSYTIDYVLKEIGDKIWKKSLLLLTILICISPFLSLVPSALSLSDILVKEDKTFLPVDVINSITEINEPICPAVLGYHSLVFTSHTVTIPVSALPVTPWVWEWGGKKCMEYLQLNPPRVCIYNPDYEIWSHKLTEYAPEFDEFITDNYTSLLDYGYGDFYILNNYYSEAIKKIQTECISKTGYPLSYASASVHENTQTIDIVYNDYKDHDNVMFATWSDENGQDDLHWYEAVNDGNTQWNYSVNLADHLTNGKYTIHVYITDAGTQYMTRAISCVANFIPSS